MMDMIKKYKYIYASVLILVVGLICGSILNEDAKTLQTSTAALSNKSIGWGIKRADNHTQPDLGSENKRLIDEYNGIAMGNSKDKYVYLTFDMGYEAGYTKQILETLKENNTKACFFITAHYLNTQPEIVKQMVKEGHIVGNQSPYALMDMHKRE